MSTKLNGMSLDEFVEKVYQPKDVEVTVSVGKGLSGADRLKKTIRNLNSNIQKAGLQMFDEAKGVWVDVMTPEELAKIEIPVPEVLTNLEMLKRATCFASEAKDRLGKLECEPILRGVDYI